MSVGSHAVEQETPGVGEAGTRGGGHLFSQFSLTKLLKYAIFLASKRSPELHTAHGDSLKRPNHKEVWP